MKTIQYKKKGSGYLLQSIYSFETNIYPDKILDYEEIRLTPRGLCIVSRRYWWDGPSGPTIDTLDFMRASLEHDVLTELMREGLLDKKWGKKVDVQLLKTCMKDGMHRIRAGYCYRAVRAFGDDSKDVKNKSIVDTAPS